MKASALLVLLAAGCTMSLYSGPKLPSEALAIIEPADTTIHEMDGQEIPSRIDKILVRPGFHSATISFRRIKNYVLFHVNQRSRGTAKVCFMVVAGKNYWTVPVIKEDSSTWYPGVIEAATRIPAMVPCLN